MPTALEQTLFNQYDIDGSLLLALEAFINKKYKQDVIQDFIKFPDTMAKLLETVVYDGWGGFSYIHDWHRVAIGDWDEEKGYEIVHESGYSTDTLHWLHDCSEIDYTKLMVY